MTYETERLIFRPWTVEDAEECFALASDEHVGPPCGWLPHICLDETKSILERMLVNDHTFCFIEKSSGKIIGNMGIDELHDSEKTKDGNSEGEMELGFWVGYPYWNQGYMTEAVLGTMDYCFNSLGLTKLWCGNFSDNHASGRVQEKCGFKYEYTRKVFSQQLNKEVEIIQRSITKNEWKEVMEAK